MFLYCLVIHAGITLKNSTWLFLICLTTTLIVNLFNVVTNPFNIFLKLFKFKVPELLDPAPAVLTFTSTTASTYVIELLHRLTGFLGNDRATSEEVHLFDLEKLGKNNRKKDDNCICSVIDNIG